MIDVTGNEISIGDKVITTTQGYEELTIGTVVGITPKKCYVIDDRDLIHENPKKRLKTTIQIYKIN
jgi:hypothetical protein